MQEKVIKLETECNANMYRAWYRCNNCGCIFQFDLNKGTKAADMKGECPTCGIKSGTAHGGVFPLIKYNPEQDAVQRHYFK